ncbi:MAG TPA: hypothetical protein VFW07_12370 [Parafilimonas sp.]|nr:hypothetical protein [Parafilimonas sp.]
MRKVTISYRGRYFPAVGVNYREVTANAFQGSSYHFTLVSTEELNGILKEETQSKMEATRKIATETASQISFFIPDAMLTGRIDQAKILAYLNEHFTEFHFTIIKAQHT